jgi:DNA polymerase-4
MLNERANGIDYAPVTVTREQKSFSHNQTFTEDTLDCDYIFSRLLSLASQLAQDLRKARVFAGKITVTIRYSDFDQKTKGVGCSYTNKDQDIYKIALKLFRQLFTRRVRVRLIGIEATRLLDDLEQQFLFTDKEEDDNVYSAMDLLRLKYGKSIIGYAGTKV